MAAEVAARLRGSTSQNTLHIQISSDYIVVINADKFAVTGKRKTSCINIILVISVKAKTTNLETLLIKAPGRPVELRVCCQEVH